MRPTRSREAGFGAQPELLIAVIVAITVIGTVLAILSDQKSATLWERIASNSGLLIVLIALIGIPLALAAACDWLVDFRKWKLGPTSALRELRRWSRTPVDRRLPGGALAMLATLGDLRVHAAVDGETALHLVLEAGLRAQLGGELEPVVERLLAAGADPNAMSKWGNTPLHAAVTGRVPLSIVKRLLAAGADPMASSLSLTPYHLAQIAEKDGPVALLLRETVHRRTGRDPVELH